jgi:hypothetical protein
VRRARRCGVALVAAAIVPWIAVVGPSGGRRVAAHATGPVAVAGSKGSCEVDRTTVGLGDVVSYSITVTSDGDHPPARSPSPGNVDGFDPIGSSTSTHQSINAYGGNLQVTTSVTVTYRLEAHSMGAHVLGPGRMFVDGSPVPTGTCVVSVVAAGKAPPAPKKNPSPFPDPFMDDPFFGGGQQDVAPFPEQNTPPADPMAQVDQLPTDPTERNLFVRIVPDVRNPVVGQQVTVKMFVYARRHPRISIKRPPGFADFVTVDLGQLDHDWHPLTLEGESWSYANIGAYAVFPLKTGSLDATPAEVEWQDVFSQAGPHDQESNTLRLEAVEPPIDGRPAGYVIGDVASGLELTAEIAPREVVDGHALLTVRMKGAGRLDPLRPILPTPDGVKWTPTGDDARQSIDFATVRGARKTTWDVAFDRAEAFDLGEVRVDVWDPIRKQYVAARAPLGRVRVTQAATASSVASATPLAQLPQPREDVGEAGTGSSLVDHVWMWGIVGGAPLAVVLAQGVGLVVSRAKKRAAARKDSPASQAQQALTEARAATKSGDVERACGAMTRALDRALESATGVRARGLTDQELRVAIEESKLSVDLSSRLPKLFAALQDARFAGTSAPSVDEVATTVDALERSSNVKSSEKSNERARV